MIGYVVVGFLGSIIVSYVALGVCFCGFPYRCKYHGWNSGAVCFGCEDEGYHQYVEDRIRKETEGRTTTTSGGIY